MKCKGWLAILGAGLLMLPACRFSSQLSGGQQTGAAKALAPALTEDQVEGILECQEAIKERGADFTSFKESELDECFDATLELQLRSENGLIGTNDFNTELTRVRSYCAGEFKEIGVASTRMVDGIVRACTPVESLILPTAGYDPLEFGGLLRALNITTVTDAAGLAGQICGAKELLVDEQVSIQVPRMVGLLDLLDNGTGQFEIAGPPSSSLAITTTIPNIPLDTRCVLPATLP